MNIPVFIKCHAYTTVYEQGKHTPAKGDEVSINIHHIVSYTSTLDCKVGSATIFVVGSEQPYRVWETLHVVEAKVNYAIETIREYHQKSN